MDTAPLPRLVAAMPDDRIGNDAPLTNRLVVLREDFRRAIASLSREEIGGDIADLPIDVAFAGGRLTVSFEVMGSDTAMLTAATLKGGATGYAVERIDIVPCKGPLRKRIVSTVRA